MVMSSIGSVPGGAPGYGAEVNFQNIELCNRFERCGNSLVVVAVVRLLALVLEAVGELVGELPMLLAAAVGALILLMGGATTGSLVVLPATKSS